MGKETKGPAGCCAAAGCTARVVQGVNPERDPAKLHRARLRNGARDLLDQEPLGDLMSSTLFPFFFLQQEEQEERLAGHRQTTGGSLAGGMLLTELEAAGRAPAETCPRRRPRAALPRHHKAAPEPHNGNEIRGVLANPCVEEPELLPGPKWDLGEQQDERCLLQAPILPPRANQEQSSP